MTVVESTSPHLANAKTLLIGGTWQSAPETYERFDPAQLSRSTGTFAGRSAARWRISARVAGVVAAHACAAAAAAS